MKENSSIGSKITRHLSEIKDFFTKENKPKGYYAKGLVRFTERFLTHRARRKFIQEEKQRNDKTRGWGPALLWAMGVVLLVNQYLLQAYIVPSGSMRDTLKEGDRLFVNKLVYGPELLPGVAKLHFRTIPQRGEVIVFENPDYISKGPVFDIAQRIIYMATLSLIDIDRNNKQNHFFVKRAIGYDGDVVKFVRGECYFKPEGEETFYSESDYKKMHGLEYNNKRLIPALLYDECQAALDYNYYNETENFSVPEEVVEKAKEFLSDPSNEILFQRDQLFGGKEGARYSYMRDPSDRTIGSVWWDIEQGQYVPRGSILPLGDNRDNSHDGRYFGTISMNDVLGRPWVKFWPVWRWGSVK